MGDRKVLSLDLETYSDIDLGKCGVYRYVEGDFHILLCAYAFDDEDAKIVDLACGEEIPAEVVDAIFDDGITKSAWNAQFERTCLSRFFGKQLSPDSWQCSMVSISVSLGGYFSLTVCLSRNILTNARVDLPGPFHFTISVSLLIISPFPK